MLHIKYFMTKPVGIGPACESKQRSAWCLGSGWAETVYAQSFKVWVVLTSSDASRCRCLLPKTQHCILVSNSSWASLPTPRSSIWSGSLCYKDIQSYKFTTETKHNFVKPGVTTYAIFIINCFDLYKNYGMLLHTRSIILSPTVDPAFQLKSEHPWLCAASLPLSPAAQQS